MHIEEILMKLNIHLFLIKNDELLQKRNEIWKKLSNSIKKEFNSEPVYNEKYLGTTIKPYKEKTNTNLYNK